MTATPSISLLLKLVKRFVACIGPKFFLLIVLMTAAALSEGLGLLLLIPLLGLTGPVGDSGATSAFAARVEQAATDAGLSFSFELVLAVFIAVIVIRQLIIFFEAQLIARTRIGFVGEIRREFFATLDMTSWKFLRGDRLDRIGQILLIDSWRIGEVALHFVRILSGLIMVLVNFAVAMLVSPLLSIVVLGGIILLTLLFSNRLHSVQQQGQDISRIHTRIYGAVENYLDNIGTAKVAGAGSRLQQEFVSTIDKLNDRLTAFVRDSEWVRFGLQVSGAIAIALALLLAVRHLELTGPSLLLLVFITARFIPRVSQINQYLHRLLHDLPAFEHANNVLADCYAHPDIALDRTPLPAPRESIDVREIVVSFGNERPVLDRFSLNVAVGEMVALIGPSGIGKSTLVDVISGLLEPDAGSVLIDGKAVPANRMGGWRAQVGYVPQTVILLQDTVERNLTWVRSAPPSAAELEKSIQCAELSSVILRLKEGLATIVGRREGGLSGGECQRLAIARELLRNPNLLVLDEATNALDVDTEARVLRNIREHYPKLTILIVAHRESATALADRVIAMREGTDAAED